MGRPTWSDIFVERSFSPSPALPLHSNSRPSTFAPMPALTTIAEGGEGWGVDDEWRLEDDPVEWQWDSHMDRVNCATYVAGLLEYIEDPDGCMGVWSWVHDRSPAPMGW
jgi:hypothetical protein